MNEIITALKEDQINIIGICGMGGVGKTTMVKEIAKRVKEENLFDEFAMSVVSQQRDETRIQRDIAEMLGLKLDEENLMVRAGRLRQRLEESSSRILIILDDIWEDFDMGILGITLQGVNKGYKVLFTSRNQGLWRELETKRDIQLEVLSDEEAWHLFKEKACCSLDTLDIAKQIVVECGRLPLALVTIGRALFNKDKRAWNDALRRLRMPCPSGEHAKVHQSLELSYNYLEDEAKSLFLLCSMFEEDYDIPIEGLVRYVMGLRLFRGVSELEATRDRVFVLVDQLKSCYLLLDGTKPDSFLIRERELDEYVKMHVMMHDVVRDVAISIAARDKWVFVTSHDVSLTNWPKKDMHEHYTHISVISEEVRELPVGLRGPETELLRCADCVLEAPNNFFEGMGELKVADMQRMKIPELPPSLRFLRNLQTLCLEHCKLESISVIGELLNLEILSFRDSNIKELPEEIGRLANLRLLDLTECCDLYTISLGVISGLVQLQELYMRDCKFSYWEGEGKEEGRNASLSEFKSLSNLNILEIMIKDVAVLPRIPLFTKLTKYTILIGANCTWGIDGYQKVLELRLYTCIPSECGISSLLKSIEYLCLEGEGSKDMVQELVREGVEGLQHKKYLMISNCDTPECLANTMDWAPPTPTPVFFPILAELNLHNLPNLREICRGKFSTVSFENLSSLEISLCGKLGNLFQLSIARGLVQLKQLQISYCEIMEEVIWKERGEDHVHDATTQIEFPKLEIMRLSHLPRLICFCRGIDEIKFPLLKELSLGNLPMLKRLFLNKSNVSFDSEENHNATFLSFSPEKELVREGVEGHLMISNCDTPECLANTMDCVPPTVFPILAELKLCCLPNLREICHGKFSTVSFGKLSSLEISFCGKLGNLFQLSIASGLVQLKQLEISNCDIMEEVVWTERGEDHVHDATTQIEFPKLEIMRLSYLPRLIYFCKGIDEIEFPLLKELSLRNLPMLKRLFFNTSNMSFDSEENRNATFPSMFPEKVAFPSLEKLELGTLTNLEELGYDQLSVGPLSKLRRVDVRSCGKLPNDVPSQLLARFPNLVELAVSDCSLLQLFDLGRLDCKERNSEMLSPLKSLSLYKLPKLNNVPELNNVPKRDPIGFMYIQRLSSLKVYRCDSLTYLFSPSMMKSIPQLRELEIKNCKMMSRIVEEENGDGDQSSVDEIDYFPQLKTLLLDNLPVLESFCQFTHDWELPLLERIHVIDCPKMKTFSLGNLPTPKLHNVYGEDERLCMDNLPVLESFCQFTDDWELPLLADITVTDCPEMNTFSLGNLPSPKLHNVYGEDERLCMSDLNSTILHLYKKRQQEQELWQQQLQKLCLQQLEFNEEHPATPRIGDNELLDDVKSCCSGEWGGWKFGG